MLNVNPQDSQPIWSQIENEIRRLIAIGRLAPGAAVPSVRELSKELRVNPGTVQKAYQVLCDAGLLAVRRGEGTFVKSTPRALAKGERADKLREAAIRYTSLAATIGATPSETREIVNSEIERIMEEK